MGEFVDEALHGEGDAIGTGGAEIAKGDVGGNDALGYLKIFDKTGRELTRVEPGCSARLAGVGAHGDEVVAPSADCSGVIDCSAKVVPATITVEVVLEVLLASPSEFDGGSIEVFGNGSALYHIIAINTATKAASNAGDVNGDFVFGYLEGLFKALKGSCRVLGGSPELEVAVLEDLSLIHI